MFHSVGNNNAAWNWSYLSVSLKHFETFCKYLKSNNFTTHFLETWYYLNTNPHEISGIEVFLTFDDGYLDNWVFVYPILKKYGLKGTVFVNPEFVDPNNVIRKNMEDVWKGSVNFEELHTLGFLSWPEILKMDAEGILQAQSHSMSHNFYFKSDRIIDYYMGESDYKWIFWYLDPHRKPFHLNEDQTKFNNFGYPIFEFGRALSLRRFIPDDELIRILQNKTKELTNSNYNKIVLSNELNLVATEYHKKTNRLGRYETDDEMINRYKYELFESKKVLEEKTNHLIEFLCWPGGGYNELSIKTAIEAGYKASTLGINAIIPQVYSNIHYKIIRRGFGSKLYINGNWINSRNSNILIDLFKSLNNSYISKVKIKGESLLYKIVSCF